MKALKGKIFMCTTFLFIGMALGLVGGYTFAKSESNTGNQLNVSVDGKVKKGSSVNIELDNIDQKQTKKSRRKNK